MHALCLHMVGTDSEPRAAAGSIDSPRAPVLPTYLFEIVQAMLVTVGDVKGVQVLQGPSFIWQAHGGYAFQDLIQLLLTWGLKTAQKAEKKEYIRTMVPFSINTVDNGNTSKDEHMCIPKDTCLPLGPAAPKIRVVHKHALMYLMRPRANIIAGPKSWRHRGYLREATMAPTGGDK